VKASASSAKRLSVERGSHEELMRVNGHYAHLFSLQAKGYR
jgi:ATP-binding cassette, subfamily B, bacterial